MTREEYKIDKQVLVLDKIKEDRTRELKEAAALALAEYIVDIRGVNRSAQKLASKFILNDVEALLDEVLKEYT